MIAEPLPLRVPRRGFGRRFSAHAASARRRIGGVRAPLANLASMPLFVAGVACINVGVFTVSFTAGLMTTGLSLAGLEYLIADED